ncbi:hypothetical protein [Robertmurraya sp.]|uniref:hypothetical protein n=1 Tax=Robertmurraya sp. TaxID=2837525 RepID=UPI003703E669
MGKNETRKTMRFWIFSGVAAILASQLPFMLKKDDQKDNQRQRKKIVRWVMLLVGAVLLGVILFWALNLLR